MTRIYLTNRSLVPQGQDLGDSVVFGFRISDLSSPSSFGQ